MKYPIYKVRNNLYHYSSVLLRAIMRNVYGMTIGENTRISRHAKLDKTNPKGVHIGSHSSVTYGVSVLTHDFVNDRHVDTFIGDYTFIGADSLILPGVRVGNHCIIGVGSVVMNDIPDNSMASGNPARIIRAGIQTKEYGILVPGSQPEPQENVTTALVAKPKPDVLAFISGELSIEDKSELEKPLANSGIDSFGLITLRTALETHLETQIPDREWSSLSRLADIACLPSVTGSDQTIAVGGNDREETSHTLHVAESDSQSQDVLTNGKASLNYVINMPQMALSGLSEAWLFKELGDIHWRLITDFLGKESSTIADAEGDRLYATFTRIHLQTDPSLRTFRENASLKANSQLRRYGASMFFSDHSISSDDSFADITIMSTFAKYGERGKNTSLIKGTPEILRPKAIPVEAKLPEFGSEYRERRELELKETLFETEYDILPSHDINGVGLLYFAAYPTIFDIGLEKFEGKGFLIGHSTVSKDICYFANSEPSETLILRVHSRKEGKGIIRHVLSLSRKSDGKRMADVISEKRKLPDES